MNIMESQVAVEDVFSFYRHLLHFLFTCIINSSSSYLWFCSSCRRHPTPTREMLEPLLRTAAAIGLTLDVSSSKALADSLDRAVVSISFCLHCLNRSHCLPF